MSLKSKLKAYESFDGAHNTSHVLNVQRNALELAKHYPDVDPSMVRAAAIYFQEPFHHHRNGMKTFLEQV